MYDSSFDSEVAKLHGRWELALVLNFLNVFELVIGNELKLIAKEIELGFVKPNVLHIKLLKGIPLVSKLLNGMGDCILQETCYVVAMGC